LPAGSTPEQAEERRLAGTRGTDESDDFTRLDVEVEMPEHDGLDDASLHAESPEHSAQFWLQSVEVE